MNKFNKKDIEKLFSNFCCSKCKNDFTQDSIKIKTKKKNIYICSLTCQKCGKDFGDIVLRYVKNSKRHYPLEVIDGPEPISVDDVIDAHNYIKHKM